MASDVETVAAVAQHFGIPTDLIDFSTSPEVAALFSRDRNADSIYASDEACIYCLDINAMREWFTVLPREEAEKYQIYPVTVNIPELHRLTAQHGCFLHSSIGWSEMFQPDSIIFPRGSLLTAEERLSIYPPTSKLEEDLQAFSQALSTSEIAEFAERKSKGSVVHMRPPPQSLRDLCFIDAPSAGADWKTDVGWEHGVYSPIDKVFTIKSPAQTTPMGNSMFATALRYQVTEYLGEYPGLWRVPLSFDIAPTPGLLEASEAIGISEALGRAWNGMAAFPYSQDQRLDCLENTILLGSTKLGSWNPERQKKLDKMLSGPEENHERWIEISLGAKNDSWSTGYISFRELVAALRDDLERLLSRDGQKLAANEPLELMRRVREASLIFDFHGLAGCFSRYLIPTQVLLQGSDLPVIFSPAQLSDFYPSIQKPLK